MRLLSVLSVLFLLTGCSQRYFIAENFDQVTANHRTVAVLPVKMVFTGKKPNDLTDAQIHELEEAESKAFMIAMHNDILESTRGGKKPIRIALQGYNQTLSLLESKGIGVRSSWDMDARELAAILGVDAVLQMEVQKTRYLSDLESFGIQLGQDILRVISPVYLWPLMGRNMSRTNDIYASAQLLNANDAIVLWSKSMNASTDWRDPAEQVIRYMTHRMARDFPYRI